MNPFLVKPVRWKGTLMTSKRDTSLNFKKKPCVLKITLNQTAIPALTCRIPMELCLSEWETSPN